MALAWFFNIPHHGHVNPTLPLVRELVRRGDTVCYFAGQGFEEKIRATGAEFRDYGEVSAFEQTRRVGHTIQQGALVAEATYELLPQVLEAVNQERPDYLLFDMSAPWAGIAGRRLDIPAAVVFPHLPFYWRTVTSDRRIFRKVLHSVRPGEGYWRELQRQAGRMVKDLRLRKPADINVLSSSAQLNLVFSSRYFQPYAERFDDSYVFVGPVVDTERPEETITIRRREGQPLIYIAIGTVYQAQPSFFRDCMAAFADEPYAVIMSVGRAVEPASLGTIPPNFTVGQFMPQLQILREAQLFITHGGMNSISESITLGVPMIVVPNTLEQSVNAARVEQLQAGLYIDAARVTAEKLRNAAEQVLWEPQAAEGVAKIRRSFKLAGGVRRAADAIDAFKAEHSLT